MLRLKDAPEQGEGMIYSHVIHDIGASFFGTTPINSGGSDGSLMLPGEIWRCSLDDRFPLEPVHFA